MLVTFTCPAHANITMFGNIAEQLIKMMGQSGTVPSAILASDVPEALTNLRKHVAEHEASLAADQEHPAEDEEKTEVSLHTRAGPLVALLEAAEAAECNVMWERD